MERRKRTALYGGTFDPVHIGHMAVAKGLIEKFAVDEVVFIPAHIAPHKRETSITPPFHRYAMLALATQHYDRLRVSTSELEAPEKPYTVETLSRLERELGEGSRLFFVMGADSWSEIATWKDWERVLLMTDHIVMTRPGYPVNTDHVTPTIRERIVDLQGRDAKELAAVVAAIDDTGKKIFITDEVFVDVSATSIRAEINRGLVQDWMPKVPPQVATYIIKYGLYR